MNYTNSPLVEYVRLSPHNSGIRTHAIDRITPHHVVGLMSVEALGAEFCGSRNASSNYGIGADGRVGLYVPENSRAWTSSSSANDQRAVTIECADEPTWPYKFSDTVYNRLIELCVDICRRNGKRKLLWLGDKNKSLSYIPAEDEMLLTVHRWFSATQCPGAWMMDHMADLAEKVTNILGGENTPSNPIEVEPTMQTCMIPGVVLKRGATGGYVKTLQTLLQAQKFPVGDVDGKFGPATLASVKNFQLEHKLVIDGSVGPKTWEELLKFE